MNKDNKDDNLLWVEDDDDNTQDNKYLLFNLGTEIYGVGIKYVINIIELQKITEVPDLPSYIKGVINLRGAVIPVMDLRLRFNMTAREYDDRTCIIIVKLDSTQMGFIVDTVAEVHDIFPHDIAPPPSFRKTNGKDRYISGLGKVGESVKIILDVEKILYSEDVDSINDKIMA
ncbi:chemotaxis protein CheW [Spirochaeta cellobiosiphila]|uniref:chemotaxis protein CheW n=1 Tax=Spirochaeta cellobiosiphila TaxID=504483 RepID=UPI0004216857|nr:chemotaxis protein CheW [Spirochaeta cellobiosiphila]